MINGGQEEVGWAELVDLAEERLPAREAEVVLAAVDRDEQLRRALDWIRRFQEVRRAAASVDPPAHARGAVIEQFRRVHRPTPDTASPPRPGLVERLRATLVFDSALDAAAAGARSLSLADPVTVERHLAYCTSAADIAVDLYPDRDGIRMDGQVLSTHDRRDQTLSLHLLRDAAEVAACQTDDLGQFSFGTVAPAAYQLTILGELLRIDLDLDTSA